MTDATPPPGSDAALAIGCICSRQDNNWGAGMQWGSERVWFTRDDCPLHGHGVSEAPAQATREGDQ